MTVTKTDPAAVSYALSVLIDVERDVTEAAMVLARFGGEWRERGTDVAKLVRALREDVEKWRET